MTNAIDKRGMTILIDTCQLALAATSSHKNTIYKVYINTLISLTVYL